MLSRSYTAGILGVEGYVITVEADVGLGLPCLTIVGQVSGARQGHPPAQADRKFGASGAP